MKSQECEKMKMITDRRFVSMNIRQLDCFLTVADLLSFSAAAEKLYLSQSAVSQQIISLENDIGCQLFIRDRRSANLTPAGEFLCTRLKEIKPLFQEAIFNARDIAEKGSIGLSIGYDGPMAEAWIGLAIRRFHSRLPGTILKIRKEPVSYLTNLLLNNSLDLIVTHEIEVTGLMDIEFQPLTSASCCLFVSKEHRLASYTRVGLEVLEGETLIVDSLSETDRALSKGSQYLERKGVNYQNAQFVSNGDVIFSMVEAGLGVFIASHLCDEFARRYKVVGIDLDIPVGDAVLGLAWKRQCSQPSECIQGFIKSASEAIRQVKMLSKNSFEDSNKTLSYRP
jgi:DNA-binding transcriptional LysR family regulator